MFEPELYPYVAPENSDQLENQQDTVRLCNIVTWTHNRPEDMRWDGPRSPRLIGFPMNLPALFNLDLVRPVRLSHDNC